MFRPIKLRHYVAYMERSGFSPAQVYANSGLTAESVARSDLLVDIKQYRQIVSNMIDLTGNQGIGLEVGATAELNDFGVVGHALLSAPTPLSALELWIRYSNTLVGQLTTVRLEKATDKSWALAIDERRPVGFLFNFSVEELLMMALRIGNQVTRRLIMPDRVELSYPEPKHHQRYRELIPCPLRFNAPLTRIAFEGLSLSEPLRGYDEDFHSLCVRHCASVMQQISVQSPFATRIRSHLLASIRRLPNLEELSSDIGMSSRTLRRRLREEDYTYQRLVAEVRLELAKEYLRVSRLTAKETAYLLGFEDTNAFRRAFRSWTGQTVREFQDHEDG